jgi:hypothetical protein
MKRTCVSGKVWKMGNKGGVENKEMEAGPQFLSARS